MKEIPFDDEDPNQHSAIETSLPELEWPDQRFGLERHLQEFLRDNWNATSLSNQWEMYSEEGNPDAGYDEDIKWQSGQKQLEINKLVGLKIGAICITPEYITTADPIRVNTTIYGEELQNNSVLFHYRPSLTTYDVSMSAISKNEFEVIIGPFNEPGAVDYYVTAENTTGNLFQSLDYYFTVHILNASSNNGNNPFHIPGFILGPALLAIIIMSTIFLLWKKRKSNR